MTTRPSRLGLSRTISALLCAAALLLWSRPARCEPAGLGFVGESRCGNPTCHGAGLPATEAQRKGWQPWKSARTQWLDHNIDRHSDAYNVLQRPAAKTIADYMGISATDSDKCLVCHAPRPAMLAPDSQHRAKDGVSCEHCHGPAQQWLSTHTARDWRQKTGEYAAAGFYDNTNFRVRAEKCASCHVEIDHEIVAAGHPPLQFEMVAYAQVMKHWDDQRRRPANSFSVDPTLWSIGQVVGLRHSMHMLGRRAGANDYQGLGKFHGFESENCYQCHHKLLDDALRQGLGHYRMVSSIVTNVFPARQAELVAQWNGVVAAVQSKPAEVEAKAAAFAALLTALEPQLVEHGIDRDTTRRILDAITSSGDDLKKIKRFSYEREPRSNVVTVKNIGTPWWYTTGAPEQAILAIESLCEPAAPGKCTGPNGIDKQLAALFRATNRFDFNEDAFAAALRDVRNKVLK
jgi:hypothetical protein